MSRPISISGIVVVVSGLLAGSFCAWAGDGLGGNGKGSPAGWSGGSGASANSFAVRPGLAAAGLGGRGHREGVPPGDEGGGVRGSSRDCANAPDVDIVFMLDRGFLFMTADERQLQVEAVMTFVDGLPGGGALPRIAVGAYGVTLCGGAEVPGPQAVLLGTCDLMSTSGPCDVLTETMPAAMSVESCDGTNLRDAVDVAASAFGPGGAFDDCTRDEYVVLFTHGGANRPVNVPTAVQAAFDAAQAAKANGVTVVTVYLDVDNHSDVEWDGAVPPDAGRPLVQAMAAHADSFIDEIEPCDPSGPGYADCLGGIRDRIADRLIELLCDDCNGNGQRDPGEDFVGVAAPCGDCNTNGIRDGKDIECGLSSDVDSNGVPDECEAACVCHADISVPCTSSAGASVEFLPPVTNAECAFACECSDDGDCLPWEFCDAGTGVCQLLPGAIGTNGAACTVRCDRETGTFPVGQTVVTCESFVDSAGTNGEPPVDECVFGVEVLGGCSPFQPPVIPPCVTDEDCDDGDNCTTDGCDPVAGCYHAPIECPEGQFCDPETGECIECLTDEDCTHEDLCTTGVCVDGFCQGIPVECPVGFVCDPDTGKCVKDEPPAEQCEAGRCDDGNLCTDDICRVVDGVVVCTNTPIVCEPGVCDPETGECVECLEDADCDDGEFCNGPEVCTDNVCEAGPAPCAEDEVCNETVDLCLPPLTHNQGAGEPGRIGCGIFNGVGMILLPLTMVVWLGVRTLTRRRL